ncbi:hypothetical protein K474DRAFT_1677261 [Panus rudis PR-1116 ss-1]|nr:hypothetical protein K474DRAFT_1677261 [Panus rudis PR-1116 ss-1]
MSTGRYDIWQPKLGMLPGSDGRIPKEVAHPHNYEFPALVRADGGFQEEDTLKERNGGNDGLAKKRLGDGFSRWATEPTRTFDLCEDVVKPMNTIWDVLCWTLNEVHGNWCDVPGPMSESPVQRDLELEDYGTELGYRGNEGLLACLRLVRNIENMCRCIKHNTTEPLHRHAPQYVQFTWVSGRDNCIQAVLELLNAEDMVSYPFVPKVDIVIRRRRQVSLFEKVGEAGILNTCYLPKIFEKHHGLTPVNGGSTNEVTLHIYRFPISYGSMRKWSIDVFEDKDKSENPFEFIYIAHEEQEHWSRRKPGEAEEFTTSHLITAVFRTILGPSKKILYIGSDGFTEFIDFRQQPMPAITFKFRPSRDVFTNSNLRRGSLEGPIVL